MLLLLVLNQQVQTNVVKRENVQTNVEKRENVQQKNMRNSIYLAIARTRDDELYEMNIRQEMGELTGNCRDGRRPWYNLS